METSPAVQIASGRLRGRLEEGVRVFRGVPYAAAPVGELRFAAPQPHPGWDGVREAVDPGPNAPQFVRAFPALDLAPLVGDGWRPGDEFLSLNVWAPAEDGRTGRPVMVWVHGGAFALGSKDAAVSDGAAFARSGVVCVAINYRMGIEGFLPVPGAPTNLGLRDQLFALGWVRDNIAAFGGDPANVTVFGESAGAMCLGDLLSSPLAAGLFRRAILQSGHGAMVRSLPVAAKLVRRVAKVLGCKPTVEGFRSKTAEEAVRALEAVQSPTALIDLREADGREPAFGLSKFLPVWGDEVRPRPRVEALRAGAGADVELLIGTNREEMNLYFVPTGVKTALPKLLGRVMLGRSQPRPGEVLRAFGWRSRSRKPGPVFTDAMHDLVFRWPARRFAEAHRGRTHVYEFDWRSPACGGELGACHGQELGFVFKTLSTVTGPTGLAGESPPQALADRMHALWVAFASGAHPPWPEYSEADRTVFQVAADRAEVEAPSPAAPFLP